MKCTVSNDESLRVKTNMLMLQFQMYRDQDLNSGKIEA